MDDRDEFARLAEWRALEALPPGFPLRVHPDDEMLQFLVAAPAVRRGRARLHYLRSGQEALHALERVLDACGRPFRDWREDAALLEFACGHGRVTRHLAQRVGPSRIWSSDVVGSAVGEVASAYGVHSFLSHADPDAVRWPRAFDAIFVASLFSHLPRRRFEAWLRRLRDALTSDGLLIFSTHGRAASGAPPPDGDDFAFVPASESDRLSTAEYGSTFVAPELVARMARDAGFADVRWRTGALWWIQDLFVASPGRPLPAEIPAAPRLDGMIGSVDSERSRGFWLHGWASCRIEDGPVTGARLHLGGREMATATLHESADRRGTPEVGQVDREWHVHGAVPAGLDGRHAVALTVQAARGAESCVDVRTVEIGGTVPVRFVDDEEGTPARAAP